MRKVLTLILVTNPSFSKLCQIWTTLEFWANTKLSKRIRLFLDRTVQRVRNALAWTPEGSSDFLACFSSYFVVFNRLLFSRNFFWRKRVKLESNLWEKMRTSRRCLCFCEKTVRSKPSLRSNAATFPTFRPLFFAFHWLRAFRLHVTTYFTVCVNLLRVGRRGFGFTPDRKWPVEGEPAAFWESRSMNVPSNVKSTCFCAFICSFFSLLRFVLWSCVFFCFSSKAQKVESFKRKKFRPRFLFFSFIYLRFRQSETFPRPNRVFQETRKNRRSSKCWKFNNGGGLFSI